MKQIRNEEELVGKIIKKVINDSYDYLIVFTDDTFCVIHTDEEIYSSIGLLKEEYDLTPSRFRDDLIELGVMTQEQMDDLWKQHQSQQNRDKVKEELEVLKRLKEKYENANQPIQ